jgi:hypothetical protein
MVRLGTSDLLRVLELLRCVDVVFPHVCVLHTHHVEIPEEQVVRDAACCLVERVFEVQCAAKHVVSKPKTKRLAPALGVEEQDRVGLVVDRQG